MDRILLSVPDDKPWSFGRHLAVALRELGTDVRLFDFRSSPDPDRQLLGAAARHRPVVHILWKGERIAPETLRRLRAQGVYNVLWYPDGDLPLWLRALAPEADLCCTQGLHLRGMLREAGLTDAERVLEGFTPSCFACAPMGPDEERRYGCDVVTVGTIDRHEGYRRRLRALNTLIREGLAVRWWGRHMSWLGNPLRDSLSPARRAWGGAKVWGPSFTQACLGGRIFLAIPRFPERAGGLSNRAFWATGVGAFYLCLYKAGMEEFFELGREVAVFRNEDEMVELVHHYLTHEDKRARIARAGQRRTLSCYTNQQVLRRIFALAVERGGPQVRLPHAT